MTAAPVVVDASVLLKVATAEPEASDVVDAIARATAADVPLLVLPLTRYEVGNVLLRIARAGGRGASDVERAILDALALVSPAEDPADVANVAIEHGLTYYDAAYLALTRAIDAARLWTYDDRLGRAAEKERVRITAAEVATER